MTRSPVLSAAALGAGLLVSAALPAAADETTAFRIAWSAQAGGSPWGYIAESGIMDKWAAKYGIDVEIVQVEDYLESVRRFDAHEFDGVTASNLEALSIAAGDGVDSTALIIGARSNGEDAVILKGAGTMRDLAGRTVGLGGLPVSRYLLARGLQSAGMSETDIASLIDTRDRDMAAAFESPGVEAVVSRNPVAAEILSSSPDATEVFDSSRIPGEILDLTLVNTKTLDDNPDLGLALTGAWYEVMTRMARGDEATLAAMARVAGLGIDGFRAQLEASALVYDPAEAVDQAMSSTLPDTLALEEKVLFDAGLPGLGAPNPDPVGISYPSGIVRGNEDHVKLRFDATYMEMAASGEL